MFITNPEDVPFKNDVYHLAKTVRAAPLSQGPNMPWLPYSNNIEEENIMVPTVVYNSLACFLSEGSEGEEKKEGECKGTLSTTCSFPCSRPLELCTKWNAENIKACFLTPSIEKPNQFKRGHYSVEQVWSWNFI